MSAKKLSFPSGILRNEPFEGRLPALSKRSHTNEVSGREKEFSHSGHAENGGCSCPIFLASRMRNFLLVARGPILCSARTGTFATQAKGRFSCDVNLNGYF